jgi:hypothetical protein
MRAKTALYASVALGLLAVGYPASMNAQQTPAQPSAAVAIDGDDIGGVVTSRFGPEAGVWVIAETTELGTRFAKMVVTDDLRPLCATRSARGPLPALGARLWPDRFAESRGRSGKARRSFRGGRSGSGVSFSILSRHLLVFAVEDSRQELRSRLGCPPE